jgi:DNA modification methylase
MTPTDPLLTESTTIDRYEFKPNPIKGYPELYWRGKRPFTSTVFYPAQHKETHGKSVEAPDGKEWRNKIFWGDNLQVMSHLLKEYRGKVDLIYIDPPYDSKADYKKKIDLRGHKTGGDYGSFEEKQYTDIWSNDEYLQFMYERISICRELLSDTGAIYIHVDYHKVHLIRCIIDSLFGYDSFQNEIIWNYSGWNRQNNTYFNKRHDNILYYSKSSSPYFEPYRDEWESKEDYVKARKQKVLLDEDGEEYVLSDAGNGERIKRYLKDALAEGRHIDDVWFIDKINNSDKQKNGYPTQKPEALLERIISSSSPTGGLVLDCFMGSGTTQAVAMKLGRRFIGADINLGAVQTTTKRLLKVAAELEKQQPKLGEELPTRYTGFEVYNVNNYDVFRNPLEAKDLLLDALEVNRFPAGNLFDGEKDGRLVKIMPVNRIASRADLNELITGFNYAEFDRRKAEHPSKAVERIMLVCMGHEPDLRAQLQNQVGDFKLDVEVVDILRDRQDLQFKRDSEAVIEVKDGQLVIKSFFPMNLLQKLSLQQENVNDWRELVESVMIDWNYDGAVISEPETDIPDRSGLVKGTYAVPASAANIRVKITDLLSESLEMDVVRG